MKRVDGIVIDSNQTTREEEHQKKASELLEENKELRKEKNELEQALRNGNE